MTYFYQLYLTCLTIPVLILSCNKESFKGQTEIKPAEPPKVTRELNADCEAGSVHNSQYEFDVEGAKGGTTIKLKGALCAPKIEEVETKRLHIMFAIDISGSMQEVDPLVAGSCKRFEAAKALSDDLLDRFEDPELIRVHALYFGDGATAAFSGDISLKEFSESQLTTDIFCYTPTPRQSTNYDAAFQWAEATLREVNDESHFYMITDGEPTLDEKGSICFDPATGEIENLECKASARDSATKLREITTNVNVLFLSDPIDPAESEKNRDFLSTDITGDDNRVKFASSAKEAAKEIQSFEKPQAENVYGDDLIVVGGLEDGANPVDFSVNSDDNRRWTYEATFELPKKSGDYKISVMLQDQDGNPTDLTTDIIIRLTIAEK